MKSNTMILAVLCLGSLYYHCSNNAADSNNDNNGKNKSFIDSCAESFFSPLTRRIDQSTNQVMSKMKAVESKFDGASGVAFVTAGRANWMLLDLMRSNPRRAPLYAAGIGFSTLAAGEFGNFRSRQIQQQYEQN